MSNDGTQLRIGDEGLELYGENVARLLRISGKVHGGRLAKRLAQNVKRLGKRRDALLKDYGGSDKVPPAAEWLLDNYYIVRREGMYAAAEFDRGGSLPRSGDTAALIMLCRRLVQSGDGIVDKKRFELFFSGCRLAYTLSRRELSLLITALKTAVIQEIAGMYMSCPLTDEAAILAKNLFTTLRELATLDFSDTLERVDKVEQLLQTDPAGVYPLMSEKSKYRYKQRIEKLAKYNGVSEIRITERILLLAREGEGQARHVGYHLFSKPSSGRKYSAGAAAYILTLAILSLLISLFIADMTKSTAVFFLVLLPVFELVKLLCDRIMIAFVRPSHIPRLDLTKGVPAEGRTICVISALLTDTDSGKKLGERLEQFWLANRDCGKNLQFGILADLTDSDTETTPNDESVIDSARLSIDELNQKYGGGFFFFIRPRAYNKADKKYAAFERKRGAIYALCRLLKGESSDLDLLAGNALALRGVKYVITLDEDTRLVPGAAGQLIGAMLHPINKPVIDEKARLVVSGHGIIHPRMSTELSSANASGFAHFVAGQGGIDPYGADVSELYMDVFGNGGFAGKGIIDISAYLRCLSGRIPDNSVLSHDALEGAYLRGGYMSDVELTDTFPRDALAYFRRMHRWVRGDWQNAPWLLRRGRVLSQIDRFRLFDSIRRSLMPPLYFALLVLAFFFPARSFTAAALVAVVSLFAQLLSSCAAELFRRDGAVCRRHSYVLRGVECAYVQAMIKLKLLPCEAFVCLDASVRAIWRMSVSRRHMLDWTPASAFADTKNGALKYFGSMWTAPVSGIIIALFAPSVLGKALGIVWALSPLTALCLSNTKSAPQSASAAESDYLLSRARQIWAFFTDFCTAVDHFLPPDNWQERPPIGVAHRTSPTNIGLCLVSCLAALDLRIASRQEALGIVENILATIRRMPKWHGHLYNWYGTKTLRPLRPAYVSTVDSGNLAICLMIMREGLKELGQTRLATQCDELLAPMSFSPLYDSDKRLFSIGMDVEKGALSPSCYDLFASEARSASFLAIARGDVPLKHWKNLSRALVQSDGYRGMASWTGSMFEYLMPRLFFVDIEGSLLYESDRFCVGVQKKRTAKAGLPWGISESAYYSLDPALNYKYKAHGCGDMALKRGMDEELVVSPYSSFLALSCSRRSAVKNLRKLENFDCVGKYGFWEAVDFTGERSSAGAGETVRCVMAHHLGMSLIAAANTLCGDLIPKRLMRDPSMAAYSCLLEEKLPLCSTVMRRCNFKPAEKPPRAAPLYWEKRDNHSDFACPACGLLSNGLYNLLLTDSGASRALYGRLAVYNAPSKTPDYRHGIELFLLRESEIIPLLPSPEMENSAISSWQFSFSGAKFDTTRNGIRAQILAYVSEDCFGEKRVISVSPADRCEQSCELLVMLEPLLIPYADYLSHPAFCKLGMHAKQLGDALIVRRIARGDNPELFLCLATSEQAQFSARRSQLPGRGGLYDAVSNIGESNLGWLYDPMVCAKIPLRLKSGADSTVEIAIAVGTSESEAYASAHKILIDSSAGSSIFLTELAVGLKMTDRQLDCAMELLCTVCFPKPAVYSKSELWRFGISGERPIFVFEIDDSENPDEAAALDEAAAYIKSHTFLNSVSVGFDLVFITDEGGDYLRPAGSALRELIRKFGSDGGIFIVDRADNTDGLIRAAAKRRVRSLADKGQRYDLGFDLYSPLQRVPEYKWNDDQSFSFYVNRSLPPRAWGNILTNGRFGYFATDCGTGHMWYGNAREYQINNWLCDSLAAVGTETLRLNGKSLFAAPDDSDCHVSFGFGYAKWEKTIDSTYVNLSAFVPPDVDARVLILRGDGSKPVKIEWWTDLVLGSSGHRGTGSEITLEEGVFTARRTDSPYPNEPFTVCASAPCKGFTASREAWLSGEADNDLGSGEGLGLLFETELPFVLVCGCGDTKKLRELCENASALDAMRYTKQSWRSSMSKIRIQTPLAALDRLYNGWLPYQAVACRLLGRCSIYQSGGAVGFRDQLQDAVNLILMDSSIARSQILACCRRQYSEGDVMHWWHETGRGVVGVRTLCSDDLVWLPWALCEYVEKTGDTPLCFLTAPFLSSEPLKDGERDRYEAAVVSADEDTVLSHCKRALDLVLERGTGDHGLLKMGIGDWNDGMNAVGIGGKGESVWLTWFFSHTAHRFASLLSALSDGDNERYETAAAHLGKSADAAWDGDHYLRGYFDDGTPLGSESQSCCKIDSIAQSFAALCPEADRLRVDRALSSAAARLYDPDNSLVKLLDPPFENAEPSPGYIESYGPAFRENGGQYTHGAIFLIMALLRENRSEEAIKLIEAILPGNRLTEVYGAEPYVIAADIYANNDCMGHAGWSWYTGSAAWLFRVVTEELLGLKMRGGKLFVEPKLPSDWGGCHVTFNPENGTEPLDMMLSPNDTPMAQAENDSSAEN